MKIAVCMSGQLRQWEIAKENQKWFWETSELRWITLFTLGIIVETERSLTTICYERCLTRRV